MTDVVESWRKEKLNESKRLTIERGTLDSTTKQEEAGLPLPLNSVFVGFECVFIYNTLVYKGLE